MCTIDSKVTRKTAVRETSLILTLWCDWEPHSLNNRLKLPIKLTGDISHETFAYLIMKQIYSGV